MSVRIKLRGANYGPNGYAVLDDGDIISADGYGRITIIRKPTVELPWEIGATVWLNRLTDPSRACSERAYAVRTGIDGWQVTGYPGYLSNIQLVDLILLNGGDYGVLS